MTGTVKWFDDKKGYGFIKADDDKKDVFVHYSNVDNIDSNGFRTLLDGQKVEYELTKASNGRLQACNVRSLKKQFKYRSLCR